MTRNVLIVVLLLSFLSIISSQTNEFYCDGNSFQIEDSAQMNSIIASVRTRYLASRPTPISSLYITMLIPTASPYNSSDIIWKRGSYDPYMTMYPARYCIIMINNNQTLNSSHIAVSN